MKAAYKVHWTEHERGWGSRPDGTTVHVTKEEAENYIEDYWKREKERNNDKVPDYYTVPGEPFLSEIDAETEEKLKVEPSFWLHVSWWA